MPDLATLPQPPAGFPPAPSDVLLMGRPAPPGSPPGTAMIPYGIPISTLPAGTDDGPGITPVVNVTAPGASYNLAFASNGDIAYNITLTEACALTISGGVVGQYQEVKFQINPATFQATVPGGILWPGGTTPTPSTTEVSFFIVSTMDAGETLIGRF